MQKIKTVAKQRGWTINNHYEIEELEQLDLNIGNLKFEYTFNHETKALYVSFEDETRTFGTQKEALQWCKSKAMRRGINILPNKKK